MRTRTNDGDSIVQPAPAHLPPMPPSIQMDDQSPLMIRFREELRKGDPACEWSIGTRVKVKAIPETANDYHYPGMTGTVLGNMYMATGVAAMGGEGISYEIYEILFDGDNEAIPYGIFPKAKLETMAEGEAPYDGPVPDYEQYLKNTSGTSKALNSFFKASEESSVEIAKVVSEDHQDGVTPSMRAVFNSMAQGDPLCKYQIGTKVRKVNSVTGVAGQTNDYHKDGDVGVIVGGKHIGGVEDPNGVKVYDLYLVSYDEEVDRKIVQRLGVAEMDNIPVVFTVDYKLEKIED